MPDNERGRYNYEIRLPILGGNGATDTIVTATTAEGAGDCVRILLAQQDETLTEIIVRVVPKPVKR